MVFYESGWQGTEKRSRDRRKTSLNIILHIKLTFETLKVYIFENDIQFKFQFRLEKNDKVEFNKINELNTT